MIINFESHLTVKVLTDTDGVLRNWIERLKRHPDLELGADARLIRTIENDLRDLSEKLQILEPQFSMSRVPLGILNKYHVAATQLSRAVKMASSIRSGQYGCTEYTNNCLKQMAECHEAIRKMQESVMLK